MGTLQENQRVVDEYLAKFKKKNETEQHTTELDPQDIATVRMNPMGQTSKTGPKEICNIEEDDNYDIEEDYDIPEIAPELMQKDPSRMDLLIKSIQELNKGITQLNQTIPGLARNMLMLARAIEPRAKGSKNIYDAIGELYQ